MLAVASGRVPVDPLADAVAIDPGPRPARASPDAADVDGVRFDTAARGYRMADVDARLDALRETARRAGARARRAARERPGEG